MNLEEVRSTGLEYALDLRGKAGKWEYQFSGTYAFTRSLNLGDPATWGEASYGKQMVYIPLHSGNLLVRIAYGPLNLTYQFNAYSERFTTSSNEPSRRDWLYPYFMNDVSLGADFTVGIIHLTTEIKAYNLFNESYRSVLYRPMPGRNYMLVLKFRL
jgi:iron complex outermembrane receptor protein